MIDFDHVVKQYGKSNVRAVDDLTLHVGKGQLFGFIGPRDHRRRVDEGRSDCR